MDNVNKNDFIRTLKMFCYSFMLYALIYVITIKLLQYNSKITLSEVLLFAFFLSLGSSIGYYKRYKKYSEKIVFDEISNEDIIVKLQDIMKDMHWSIKDINSKHMVFKSSALRTSITEYLIMNVDENSLELSGPKYYVEKVVRRLTG